jgi:hypothetical protein
MQNDLAGAQRRVRRLALTALAAGAVAIAGAAAIYAIHRTMPATGLGEAAASGKSVGARSQPVAPARGGGTGEAGPAPDIDRRAAAPPAAGADPIQPPRPPQPPVSLRPPSAPQATDRPDAPAEDAPAAQRSPAKRPAGAAAPARAAPAHAAAARPAPKTRAPDAGRQDIRTQPDPHSRSGERPAAQDSQGGAHLRAGPTRLAEAQQAGCAEEGLVSRLICNERVRLRFCRDRWNAHPDCIVEAPRNDP